MRQRRTGEKEGLAIPLPPRLTDDLSTGISTAAESLVAVWLRAAENASERVSPSQLRALTVISRHDGINLSGLAGELGAIPSSATRLCDRLVAAGLLTREPAPANKREVSLHLSREGQGLLAQIAENRRADLSAVIVRMAPATRRSLLAALESFADAAGTANGADRLSEGC